MGKPKETYSSERGRSLYVFTRTVLRLATHELDCRYRRYRNTVGQGLIRKRARTVGNMYATNHEPPPPSLHVLKR